MKWQDCTMLEALEHAKTRKVECDKVGLDRCEAYFTDGTAIACISCGGGFYSDVTPCDLDAPDWKVFK